jgi:hypothetical protein
VTRLIEARAGCVRGSTSLKLPLDCWQFIQDMRASPAGATLPDDLRDILGRVPSIEVRPPISEPKFVVVMTRPQAEALQRWLRELLDGLARNDDRRLTCFQCIGRVAVAIRLSET